MNEKYERHKSDTLDYINELESTHKLNKDNVNSLTSSRLEKFQEDINMTISKMDENIKCIISYN